VVVIGDAVPLHAHAQDLLDGPAAARLDSGAVRVRFVRLEGVDLCGSGRVGGAGRRLGGCGEGGGEHEQGGACRHPPTAAEGVPPALGGAAADHWVPRHPVACDAMIWSDFSFAWMKGW